MFVLVVYSVNSYDPFLDFLVSLTKISLIVAIRFSMTGCLVKQLKGLKHLQTLEYT